MMTHTSVSVGQRLAGRYRVDGALAKGGTSVVLFGTDVEGQEPVAIKVLMPHVATSDESRTRFEREIRVLRNLRSEHVVKVLDNGSLLSGEPFMVMERLQGRTLRDVLLADGPLLVRDTVDFVLQACEVLAEAHAAGVVHRDMKPENLFLIGEGTRDARIKVLDFGLSKAQASSELHESGERSLTLGNEVMGSPYYMAPEQLLSSKHVEPSADIWSIGIVLYELLTGRLPFAGETLQQIRARIMMGEPTSMREVRPTIPEALETTVLRCLEKAPTERFKGLAVLAASLAPFGSSRAKRSIARILRAAKTKAPPPFPIPAPSDAIEPPTPSSQADLDPNQPRVHDPGTTKLEHLPTILQRKHPSLSWTARSRERANKARSTMLMGVSIISFALGLAIGVVVSVWQHHSVGDGATGKAIPGKAATPSTSVLSQ